VLPAAVARQGYEAANEVQLAPAVHRHVHGEAERRIAVIQRALHVLVHPGVVAAHVELEYAQRIGGCGGRFQSGLADRGQHLRHAEGRRPARGGRGTPFDDGFQAANGRKEDRQPDLPGQECRRAIHPAHVAKHARPKADGIEREAVAPHRGLGFRAADQVAPRPGREVAARRLDDFLQGEKLFVQGCIHRGLKAIIPRENRRPGCDC
jgi:hypothetical protein